MSEENFETVECWRCGNLSGLRERCNVCEGVGAISQVIEKGHETLTEKRNRGPQPRTENLEPKRHDPTWAGNDPR